MTYNPKKLVAMGQIIWALSFGPILVAYNIPNTRTQLCITEQVSDLEREIDNSPYKIEPDKKLGVKNAQYECKTERQIQLFSARNILLSIGITGISFGSFMTGWYSKKKSD